MSWATIRAISAKSTLARDVISPASTTWSVVHSVSQATRDMGSWAISASRIPSEIWSQTLSGCPMLTDSLLNRNFDMNLAPHSTVGWLEYGQNSPDDAFCPTLRRLLDDSAMIGRAIADAR